MSTLVTILYVGRYVLLRLRGFYIKLQPPLAAAFTTTTTTTVAIFDDIGKVALATLVGRRYAPQGKFSNINC